MAGLLQRAVCATAAGLALLATAPIAVAAGAEARWTPPAPWKKFRVAAGLPGDGVHAIHVDGGEVWVGTDSGLARHKDGSWKSWTSVDGLPGASIRAIVKDDRTGDIWLGSWGGGLLRFTAGRFDRFTQFNSGLAGDLVFDVAVAHGRIWAATNGGVSSLEPMSGDWRLYLEARFDRPPPAVTDLLLHDGVLIAGTWGGPLMRFDTDREEWIVLHPTQLYPAGAVSGARAGGETVLASAPGEKVLWWTRHGSLFRRGPTEPWPGSSFVPPPDAGFVSCLAVRSDDEVWLGTSEGLLILAAGKSPDLRIVRRTLSGLHVRSLAFEGQDVWVGTPRGRAVAKIRDLRKTPEVHDGEPVVPATHVPVGPEAVLIGALGPYTRPISLPGADSPWPTPPVDRTAVVRALEKASDLLSESGMTFQLAENLVSFTKYGWVTPQDSYVVLRDRFDVHGLVGYIEPHARLETAVALRTGVPVVNIAPDYPTPDETLNPWIFRCGNNDPRRNEALLDLLLATTPATDLAVLRTEAGESPAQLDRWIAQASAGGDPVLEIVLDPRDERDLASKLESLRGSRATMVLTWTDPRTTAILVRSMREAGLTQTVVGSDRIVGPEFVKLAGANAGPVIAPARCPHHERSGEAPTEEPARRLPGVSRKKVLPQSAPSFDAATHLAVAIEIAGTDREAIRRELVRMARPAAARLVHGTWVVEELPPATSR